MLPTSSDASTWVEESAKYTETGSNTLSVIPGSDTSSVVVTVFSYTHDEIGMVRHKVELEGNGVEIEHSILEFNKL